MWENGALSKARWNQAHRPREYKATDIVKPEMKITMKTQRAWSSKRE